MTDTPTPSAELEALAGMVRRLRPDGRNPELFYEGPERDCRRTDAPRPPSRRPNHADTSSDRPIATTRKPEDGVVASGRAAICRVRR
jgi:hypothetical protein